MIQYLSADRMQRALGICNPRAIRKFDMKPRLANCCLSIEPEAAFDINCWGLGFQVATVNGGKEEEADENTGTEVGLTENISVCQ